MIAETPVGGHILKFFAPTPLLRDRARSVLTKEPDMIRWIDSIPSGAVFWDVGSNVGVFSLYAAIKVNCAVISFEPSASNYFVLARNIQLNGLTERVAAYCIALSGTTALGTLNLISPAMGAAMSQFGKAGEISRYWTDHANRVAHGTVGFTIDEFIARFHPPFPTHIKMDVDGLELEILKGARSTLSHPRLQSAMVELSLTHDDERREAMSLIEGAGLRFLSKGEPQGTGTESAANHLFVRPE
jgi:FkbM family methyltransferase